MKKWVFGCLGLFIIVAIGGGYAAYKFLYLPGKEYVQSFTQLKVVPELNAQVSNQAPYTPPANNALTASTVNRFVQAQQAIHAQMGIRIQELETKYQTLSEQYRKANQQPSLGESITALREVAGLFVDAKRAQVEALNAHGFSLAEYEWTRARVYEALGLPIDTTFQQVIRDAASGKMPDVEAIKNAPVAQVPDQNRELVAPFAKELTEGAALAFFAL